MVQDFSTIPVRLNTSIQPKLKIGAVNDQYEQEADSVADQVMKMPDAGLSQSNNVSNSYPLNSIQRKCTTCQDEEELVQRKPSKKNATEISPHISSQISTLSGRGNAMSMSERQFFEPRFNKDFSNVRIHSNTRANHIASSINARAFTLGNNIVFNAGQYSHGNREGKKLLAHELTHVLQQNGVTGMELKRAPTPFKILAPKTAHVALHGDSRVRRAPFETEGINLSRTDITNLASTSYWEQRTLRAYSSALHTRFTSNSEERDAVLSALWATNPPTTVTAMQERFVRVPARTLPAAAGATPTQAPALIYLAEFGPPAVGDTRPVLTLKFVSSGAPVAAPAPPAAFQPSSMSANSQGFPAGRSAYFAAHPEEHKALANWLQNAPGGGNIDAIVTTQNGTGAAAHHSVFHVTAMRTGTGTTLTGVNIDLVSQTELGPAQTLPADYQQRDGADLELDTLRANASPANRLGTITTLPANLPNDELTSIKYAIWQYFSSGSRNTEVDAIVPVGSGSRTVLYTLVFGANNAVTVSRIGETGTGVGRVNMTRMDVTRVRGFPAAPTSANLRSWWTSRYPRGGTLTANPPVPTSGTTAPTVATLTAEMNQFISVGIANQNWFNQNYDIEVLGAGPLATRLRTVHNVPGPQGPLAPADMTADTTNFNSTDLRMLELSLQTLSNDELTRVRGVKIGRKTAAIKRTANGWQDGPASQVGVTIMDSSGSTHNTTILFFQGLYGNNERLFVGSDAANALPAVTETFVHEIGHAVSHTAGIEAAFNTWVAAHPQASPTWYAESDPANELFPEAFALYHEDPHFLCNSSPLLYAWFHALATTGSAPPPAAPVLTVPTSCP